MLFNQLINSSKYFIYLFVFMYLEHNFKPRAPISIIILLSENGYHKGGLMLIKFQSFKSVGFFG